MTFTPIQKLIALVAILVLAVFFIQYILPILGFVLFVLFGLLLAGAIALFALDRLTGGDALEQVKRRILRWLEGQP